VPTFTPPVAYDIPPILPDTRGPALWLFRHYGGRPRGRSVLKQANGTWVTVDQPTQAQINAALVYYQGGRVYTITQAEAEALYAAGYTVIF